MFNIVTGSLLALDSNFDRGRCLSHVGTEGVVTAHQLITTDRLCVVKARARIHTEQREATPTEKATVERGFATIKNPVAPVLWSFPTEFVAANAKNHAWRLFTNGAPSLI
jgi:hypothetical protein